MTILTAAAADPGSLALNWQSICMRLLCAMIVGMVIGTEREYTHRPAGMRTHILVALGACAVMITGQLIFAQYSQFGSTPDPARLAAQVITGVGFLGAGTIMREGANVKGLTTAASLWSVACLGIAAGGGYYTVALVGMVFILITLTFLELIQNLLVKPKLARNYSLDADDAAAALQALGKRSGRKIAVLGDMLELGVCTQAEHYRVGRFAAENADVVLAYGPNAERTISGAITGGMDPRKATAYTDAGGLVLRLKNIVKEGDVVLFKGGRSVHMERVLESFLK